MTSQHGPDPIRPTITFDNYVIPETVKERRRPAPVPSYDPTFVRPDRTAVSSTMVSTALIVFLTFMLGVVTTLYLTRPEAPTQTATLPAPAIQQDVAPVEDAVHTDMVITEVEEQTTPANVLEQAVSASLEQNVTRQDQADLITPAGAAPADPNALSLTEILLGLTPVRAQDQAAPQIYTATDTQSILSRDKLRMLREGVLSGAYTVKTVRRNGRDRLSLRMPITSVTQDEAADLLRAAAARGEIELPDALSTADGDFDADTLIFNLVQTSLANDGTPEGLEAAREMSRRAFAASRAKTSKVKGQRIYEVTAGDSLAYISLQFYGQPSAYLKIFNANRNILKSPDEIQVGQRLIIPG